MITRINGTETTKKFIKAIVGDLQKKKPVKQYLSSDFYIDYSTKKGFSTLCTDENSGVMRNISLLRINYNKTFNKVEATIGNKTGNILIEDKPFYMTQKKALKLVMNFLENLQPENLANPKSASFKTKKFSNSMDTIAHTTFDDAVHAVKIDSSNSRSSFEVSKVYKNL